MQASGAQKVAQTLYVLLIVHDTVPLMRLFIQSSDAFPCFSPNARSPLSLIDTQAQPQASSSRVLSFSTRCILPFSPSLSPLSPSSACYFFLFYFHRCSPMPYLLILRSGGRSLKIASLQMRVMTFLRIRKRIFRPATSLPFSERARNPKSFKPGLEAGPPSGQPLLTSFGVQVCVGI